MSAQNLSQSVQEAIRQNLSGVVAGELSEFIDRAKRQEAELERVKASNAALGTEIENLQAKLAAHREMAERERAVTDRENAAQATELTLLKREASLDAKVAHAELNGVKYSMESFLRNVTVRTNVVSDVAKPVQGSPGGNGYGATPGFLARSPDGRLDHVTTTRTEE